MLPGYRVRLRHKRLEDASRDYRWRCDPELARLEAISLLCLPFPDFVKTYADELQHTPRSQHLFAIETLDGKHIGNCGYRRVDEAGTEVEIGIMLGDRSYWGRGYANETIQVLLNQLFQDTNVYRIYLATLEWNTRAQRFFQKCGFRRSGHVMKDEAYFIIMEMHRSDRF